MRLTRVAFQACSIDHSDISPFRINDLRAARIRISQNPPSRVSDFTCRMVPIGYGDAREVVDRNVSDLLTSSDHLRRFSSGSCCVDYMRQPATTDSIASTPHQWPGTLTDVVGRAERTGDSERDHESRPRRPSVHVISSWWSRMNARRDMGMLRPFSPASP